MFKLNSQSYKIKIFLQIGEDKIDISEQISEGDKNPSLILVFFKKIFIVLNKKGKGLDG